MRERKELQEVLSRLAVLEKSGELSYGEYELLKCVKTLVFVLLEEGRAGSGGETKGKKLNKNRKV